MPTELRCTLVLLACTTPAGCFYDWDHAEAGTGEEAGFSGNEGSVPPDRDGEVPVDATPDTTSHHDGGVDANNVDVAEVSTSNDGGITFVQSGNALTTMGNTVVTMINPTAAGNLLVVGADQDNSTSGAVVSIQDDAPGGSNTYVSAHQRSTDSAGVCTDERGNLVRPRHPCRRPYGHGDDEPVRGHRGVGCGVLGPEHDEPSRQGLNCERREPTRGGAHGHAIDAALTRPLPNDRLRISQRLRGKPLPWPSHPKRRRFRVLHSAKQRELRREFWEQRLDHHVDREHRVLQVKVGRIRVFLRKQGWTPESERDGE